MPYHRINPEHKKGLPDIEAWEDYETTINCKKCGTNKGPECVLNCADNGICCPECGKSKKAKITDVNYTHQWYSWICVPGCNPDSDYFGPFASEKAAVEAARAYANSQD